MNLPRQPEKVTVSIQGEPEDVLYWIRELAKRAEFKGDMVTRYSNESSRVQTFVIHPRAVND